MKLTTKIVAVVFVILTVFFYTYARLNYTAMRNYHEVAIQAEMDAGINNVIERMNLSEELEAYVMSTVNEKNLALACALAENIKAAPGIDTAELGRLASVLGFVEINIVNGDGIIETSNFSDYPGFDYASGEATKKYLDIIANPSIEIAEEPRTDAISGNMTQYFGVARKDKPGFVQVGVDANFAAEIRSILGVQHSIEDMKLGDTGFAFILSDGVYIAHRQSAKIGEDVSNQDWYKNTVAQSEGYNWLTIDGESYYAGYKDVDGSVVVACLPEAEYYGFINQFRLKNIVMAFLIGLFALIVIWFIIDRLIIKPVIRLSGDLGNIAQGKLNINRIPGSRFFLLNHSKDEIGLLSGAVQNISGVLNGLLTEMEEMSGEHNKGDIDARIDENLYSGAYRDVAAGVNTMVGSYIRHMSDICYVLNEFGAGDFSTSYAPLPGKKAVFNSAIEKLREKLKNVNNEIESLAGKALDGQLAARANADIFEGDWKKLLTDLNAVMDAVITPINESSDVLRAMAAGNFHARVKGGYKGDFALIKDSLNSTQEAISSYISEIGEILGEVSNQNLNVSINKQYIGDFSVIKDSINMIVDTFNKVLANFNESAEQVAGGSKQISDASANLSEGAAEQSAALEELNASVTQIAEHTLKNEEMAYKANALALSSKDNAEKEAAMMRATLAAMEGIDEASANISKIIKVIEEIAFQTNLLALNAAVEAARAGEHGKGFSVVAEEVRTLAGRSQTAAKDTAVLIEGSMQKTSEGARLAAETAKGVEAVVGQISEISDYIKIVAESSREQTESIEQISKGIAEVSEVTQGNTAISEECAAASEELLSQAELFRDTVAKFKLK